MTRTKKIWLILLAVAGIALGALAWFLLSRTAGDVMPLARLAPSRTLVFAASPDLSRWVDEVGSSGVAARLSRSKDWESLLQEPGIRGWVQTITRNWPRVQNVMDRSAALAVVVNSNGQGLAPVAMVRLKRGVAAAGHVEGFFDSSAESVAYQDRTIRSSRMDQTLFHYVLMGRVLVMSPSLDAVQEVIADASKDSHSVADALQKEVEADPARPDPWVFVNGSLLAAHRDLMAGGSSELWWLTPFLEESERMVLSVRVGEDISWEGRIHPRRGGHSPAAVFSSETPPMWAALSHAAALQTQRTVDFPSMWKDMMNRTGAETRRSIEEEIVFFNKYVLERKDFIHDLLPRLGPEWGLAVEPLEQDRYQIKPTHALPVVQAYLRIRDPWAADMIYRMIMEGYGRIRRSQEKRNVPMTFSLEPAKEGEQVVIRIVLLGEEANRLGAAFAPGIVISSDGLILTSFLPHTRRPLAAPGPTPAADTSLTLSGARMLQVMNGLKEAIADTIVNDRFRREVEPAAEQILARRAEAGELQKILNRIRQDLRQAGQVKPEELEREAQFRLSKYIYDERLRLIEQQLAARVGTPTYVDTSRDVRDRVGRWIRRLDLLDRVSMTMVREGDQLILQGRLRLTAGR